LTFNNFDFSKEFYIKFEIWQEGNPKKINCSLPLVQKRITSDLSKSIQLRMHDRKNTLDNKNSYPFNGTQGFSIKEVDEVNCSEQLLAWFSPDKLFQNYWKGLLSAEISKEFKEMCEFEVHYVGKSTEQNICKRISNHSTFQEILINQQPLSYKNIPSNEIIILLMRIKNSSTVVKWGNESDEEQISDYLNHYKLPDDKTISLDAEKALIKHLQPKYNKILYNNFPKKNDLINNDYHDVILYGLSDPITLIYDNGKTKGGSLFDDKDYISVEQKL
jgi:hypothetical protein